MVTIGSELPPGTLIDRRYQIQRVLGRGGFGRTYLASDQRRFGELCVLKEFVPKNQGDSVVAQKLHELFQREAQILHQLNHPQIPKFFAVFEENDRLFIAQEYINGKTYWKLLQERQQRGIAFSEMEVFCWLRHLLPVLDYLHKQNIVHRDISPDNIMLPRQGRLPVLIDFGVVKQAAPHWYEISTINPDGSVEASVSVGKLGYAPYEQIRIGQCSPRSDLYALAVTAAVLLTAKAPNSLIDPKSLEWRWQSFVKIHPTFAAILVKMMAEKPQDRYPSARAVLEELDAFGKQLARSRRPTAHQPKLERARTTLSHSVRSKEATAKALLLESTRLEKPVLAGVSSRPAQAQTGSAVTSHPPYPGQGFVARPVAVSFSGAAQPIRTHNQATTLILPPSGIQTSVKLLADTPATKLTVLTGAASNKAASRFLKPTWIVSLFTLVLLGSVALGVQSPQIMALCQPLNICADSLNYDQLLRNGEQAKRLISRAKNLEQLTIARDQLAETVAQLTTLSTSPPGMRASAGTLPSMPDLEPQLLSYRETLSRVEQRLEKEKRATELLNRAGTEAQTAEQQTNGATTLPQLTAARSQWRKALATLSAIPTSTYVADQAVDRTRQYAARLQTVDQQLAAISPEIEPSAAPLMSSAKPAVTSASPVAAAATPSPLPTAPILASPPVIEDTSPTGIIPVKPAAPMGATDIPPSNPAPESPAAQPARSSPSSTATTVAVVPSPRRELPAAMNRFLSVTQPITSTLAGIAPGRVSLIAAQTVDDVSVRLDGARVSTRGTFVANLQVENRSDRSFGFVPLFVEVRDANGQPVASRLRLNSSGDGMVAPGETLQGEVYLLDRYWNTTGSQDLTLVIREGTSGNRNFHVHF
ncbi:serine/threonine-protein kinase [Thermocoleostomius sinensis]|uniref:non-specific serine/threonine protein kinase n=1 Tax=Thermocoleostomius sinensis A174 TaxID=2016057 RepID=A0A9E8Z9T9_9CYAN|nr:serine/threonine-protein kinase [Thermocoleostomius sinensis]WAL58912.1 protein kinase [Thermocoleostomius sinensis A174]